MAAYAVIARIGRADPHLTVRDLDDDLDRDRPRVDRDPPGPDRGLPVEPVIVDRYTGPTLGERIGDGIRALREAIGQLTFYLFDPESWRQ